MPLRKQGGAAIVTIPASVLKRLRLVVGESVAMDVQGGAVLLTPERTRKPARYSLAQLLEGASPSRVKALHADTAWAREGSAVGRELA